MKKFYDLNRAAFAREFPALLPAAIRVLYRTKAPEKFRYILHNLPKLFADSSAKSLFKVQGSFRTLTAAIYDPRLTDRSGGKGNLMDDTINSSFETVKVVTQVVEQILRKLI